MKLKLFKLSECPIGLFQYKGTLCVKSEYGESIIVSNGEYFWGEANTKKDRENLLVLPISRKLQETLEDQYSLIYQSLESENHK